METGFPWSKCKISDKFIKITQNLFLVKIQNKIYSFKYFKVCFVITFTVLKQFSLYTHISSSLQIECSTAFSRCSLEALASHFLPVYSDFLPGIDNLHTVSLPPPPPPLISLPVPLPVAI